ncbi:hypothetical protein FVEG_05266 [Fusarium verticillioides 7600]|uniref:Uncharacterized protein n=1 Tax=Gibberella moniliformis (strain M3125 / FGSC 7600) TaxID=334819 RepID=W7MH01_GIBM7|nr:hypothetical protein FVEG_05266 [Fusarium verticillioides 7600]EWG44072.1 hypothetical protein FVEG_05266 [Fusarium verticillioides 7600]
MAADRAVSRRWTNSYEFVLFFSHGMSRIKLMLLSRSLKGQNCVNHEFSILIQTYGAYNASFRKIGRWLTKNTLKNYTRLYQYNRPAFQLIYHCRNPNECSIQLRTKFVWLGLFPATSKTGFCISTGGSGLHYLNRRTD